MPPPEFASERQANYAAIDDHEIRRSAARRCTFGARQ